MQGKKIGLLIIVSAIIWGGIIFSISMALKSTGCYDKIQNLLFTGVISHLLFVWIPFALFARKKEGNNKT